MADLGMVTTGNDVLAISDRERILQAMAECCAEIGYSETTVEVLLERAQVELECFERHFAGKEDCALGALNKIVSETLARISMAGAGAVETEGRWRFEGQAILELMAARPSFARLAFVESRQCGTARMHNAYESAAGVLALLIARVGGAGGTGSSSARAALGGAEALIRREIVAGRAEQLPQLLPDFVYAVLVPLVGQGEALRQAKLTAKLAAEEE